MSLLEAKNIHGTLTIVHGTDHIVTFCRSYALQRMIYAGYLIKIEKSTFTFIMLFTKDCIYWHEAFSHSIHSLHKQYSKTW